MGDATYPPGLVGLRGNHEGSQTYPHLVRDGALDRGALTRRETGEQYDLVVVGAGISGLSSAYFYRKKFGPDARILIVDNHDDFGGHAKRNEFHVDGRTLLSYGGTQAIDSPSTYRPVAMALLRELGIEMRRLAGRYDRAAYRGLGTACFFDKETFGTDRVVTGMGTRPWADFLRDSPLSDRAKADIVRLYAEKRDYLGHLSPHDKRKRLREINYATYLVEHCKVDPATVKFFQTYSHDLFGVGIDAVSALSCYENPDDYESFTYAGFDGLGLEPVDKEAYVYMFPDGNASIARLLVRALIPAAIAAPSPDAIVGARVHYDRLDVPSAATRLRLSSPVIGVERLGPKPGDPVAVNYVRGGAIERVTTRHCVLACYHGMIPYLCPEIPDEQKTALHYGPKVPFLYTHVALRNWRSFAELGVHHIVAPGAYHSYTALAFPVDGDGYRCSRSPDEPMVLFMLRALCAPGLPRKDQHRAGRAELLGTPFNAIEGHIRDQLHRMLGGAGFDGERDIAAITVNRWAHGYTYEYDSLSEPDWPKGRAPYEIARQPFGPIVIANADAAGAAYTDAAIDMAYRAVGELPRAGRTA
ncbi:MAG TPA: FAD/NAD(P)-binding protein [Steroidobacteraceae bacterium]|nr:FAD/NAD(P)-binding protein [Steroidobacteraceae bacterium]